MRYRALLLCLLSVLVPGLISGLVPGLALAEDPAGQRYCVAPEHLPQPVCAYQYNPDATQSVVLVHGLNGSAREDWAGQIALLSRQFHVVTVELPGFDVPIGQASHYTAEHFAGAVQQLVLDMQLSPFVLIGHSMGGVIALRYALQHPEMVQRMVLVSVPGVLHRVSYSREVIGSRVDRGSSSLDGLSAFAEKIGVKLLTTLESWTGRPQPSALLLRSLSDNPVALAAMQLVTQNFSAELPGLRLPILLLWGEDDTTAPLRIAQAVQARLPDARLQVFANTGHMPMREATYAFNLALHQFVVKDEWPELAHSIPPPLPPHLDEGDLRVGQCVRQSQLLFEGHYRHIDIQSCEGVVIRNARVDSLRVQGGRVSILHSHLGKDPQAVSLQVNGSDLKITASRMEGQTEIGTNGSRLDFAGVELDAGAVPFRASAGTALIFSLSEIRQNDRRRVEHRYLELERGQALAGP